jgi:hypothetical protein
MTFPSYVAFGSGQNSALSLPTQAPRDPVSHIDTVASNGSPFVAGSQWINTISRSVFFYEGAGMWILQSNLTGDILTLSDTVGTLVTPTVAGNVQIAGTANQVSSTAGANKITLALIGPYTPATYTDHGVLVGSGTAAIDALAVGTTGQVLIGATGADPAFGALGVNSGLTDHGVLIGGGNTAIDALTVGTNGQVLTGSTGADPVFSTLTSSGGTIAFTPGAGTLNLEAVPSLLASATVTLTSAQVKALESTPITLVAAQGAGKSIVPIQVQMKLVYGGTNPFTNPQDIDVRYTNGAGAAVAVANGSGFIDQSASTYNLPGIDADVITIATGVENQPLVLFNSSTAITGNAANNNTLVVTILYIVLTQ